LLRREPAVADPACAGAIWNAASAASAGSMCGRMATAHLALF
jgi:hypothetical protein